MSIQVVGTTTETVSPESSSVSLLNGIHTTTSDTDLLLCLVAIKGNEALEAAPLFDIGGTDQSLTLISDIGGQGSNGAIRTMVYGLISPGAVTNANVRVDVEFSANAIVGVWMNIKGVVTTSVAAATNELETERPVPAASSLSFASAGSTGNGLLTWCAAYGNDMAPSSVAGFTEQVDGVTAATTSDIAYNCSTLLSGAPSGATCTWNTIDESSGCYIELIPATSTGYEPGYRGTGRGVGRGVMRGA